MQRNKIGYAVVALALALGGAVPVAAAQSAAPAAAATTAQAALPPNLSQVRNQIIAQTNAERTRAGLPVLRRASSLDNFAQHCSQAQADARRMFHCQAPSNFGRAWAENVASGQSPDRVVAAWMASPGHRANILNARVTHIGVGFQVDATGRTYFTQNFKLP